MNPNLTLDKAIKIEVNYGAPSFKIPDITRLDTVTCQLRSQSVVVYSEIIGSLALYKFQRNSSYNIIGAIDIYGEQFGINKLTHIEDLPSADGFDIGLAKRNVNEISNEIRSILQFFTMAPKTFDIRWTINLSHGKDHINNCINGIKQAKFKPETIRLVSKDNIDINDLSKIIEDIRNGFGNKKLNVKIPGSVKKLENKEGLFYDINAEDLA